ncbi:hypothetical protein BVI434_2640012 [Burkholderia vietnamiensis]|nr:hypothetical protein BVI434_2640012 [Burkholderia vietnamiensis]
MVPRVLLDDERASVRTPRRAALAAAEAVVAARARAAPHARPAAPRQSSAAAGGEPRLVRLRRTLTPPHRRAAPAGIATMRRRSDRERHA